MKLRISPSGPQLPIDIPYPWLRWFSSAGVLLWCDLGSVPLTYTGTAREGGARLLFGYCVKVQCRDWCRGFRLWPI